MWIFKLNEKCKEIMENEGMVVKWGEYFILEWRRFGW